MLLQKCSLWGTKPEASGKAKFLSQSTATVIDNRFILLIPLNNDWPPWNGDWKCEMWPLPSRKSPVHTAGLSSKWAIIILTRGCGRQEVSLRQDELSEKAVCGVSISRDEPESVLGEGKRPASWGRVWRGKSVSTCPFSPWTGTNLYPGSKEHPTSEACPDQ